MVKLGLVSIILPTYNGNSVWIMQAINSIIAQTYNNRELIIINDASTNDIEKTILQYVNKDNRIQYFKNEENLKLTKTLNKGIALSQGEYIARIDDDDIWCDPEKLAKQIDFMEKNTSYGLCGTCVINIDEEGSETSRTIVPQKNEDIKSRLMRFNQFAHASMVFRKKIVGELGAYNPVYNGAEDYELRLRIGCKYKLANLPDFCLKYRHNTQGVSVNMNWTQRWYGIKIAYTYRHNYPGFWKYIIPRLIIGVLPKNILQAILTVIKK